MDAELYKAAKQGKVEFLGENPPMSTNEESAGGSGTRTNREYFLSWTHQDNNIIHLAARQGHASFIHKALQQFPILYNQENSRGDTPLHIAARFGHYSVVKLLAEFPQQEDGVTNAETNLTPRREIEDGFPPLLQAVNSEGITALDEALRNRHEKVALFLLGQDPVMACFVNGVQESPLYLAAESCCEEVMKEILNSNLPYKHQGPHGQNALHAAKYCSESSIDLLLRKRPTLVKGVDNHGKSALHYAIQTDEAWLITLLLKVDTSIAYLSDADGIPPLLKASSWGNLHVCQTILKLCPDSIEARNRNGQNIVHLFNSKYHRRVWLFLKIPEVRELINERDNEGNTALHLAIQNHDLVKAMELIHTKVVDLRITNKEGRTVLDVCESEWRTSHKQISLVTLSILPLIVIASGVYTFVATGLIVRVRKSYVKAGEIAQERTMWFLLKEFHATRGRRPNQSNVPITGPRTAYIEDDADWKQMANTLTVVATLLITITFTAVFTMPGGYDNSSGNAVLMKKAALKVFVLSDTFTLCTSITVVVLLIWAMIGERELLWSLTQTSLMLLKFALYGTLVAFVTGLYAVTASEALWVIILVFIMVTIVPVIVSRRGVMSMATGVWTTNFKNL